MQRAPVGPSSQVSPGGHSPPHGTRSHIPVAGLQVDPTDVDRVSAAIARVLNSHELANDLHLRGLTHVRRFAWDRVAAETSALYAEVMGTKRDY